MLIVIRLLLPIVVLHYANKKMANLKGYFGHIKDIDIALIRGAYKVDSVYLHKVDTVTQQQTPFFYASAIDISVEWKALLHGAFVGEFVVDDPILIFTREKVEPSTLRKDSAYFKKLKKEFMPLQINRLEINNGTIRYRDEGTKPQVDIALTHAYILAENLRNSYDSTVLLPAKVTANAEVYGGTITFYMRTNPLAEKTTFDMNTELKNTNLVQLNEFFQAYAKIDVNKGVFGMYAEAAAKNGNFTGYVKPVINDLDILGKEDRKDNLLQQLWEAIAGVTGQVFKNQEEDQVATKITLEGKLEDPDANVWLAITNILKNAFIQAIQPSIDNEINIASVDKPKEQKKTFLEKIFGQKDKDKDESKEKRKDDKRKT